MKYCPGCRRFHPVDAFKEKDAGKLHYYCKQEGEKRKAGRKARFQQGMLLRCVLIWQRGRHRPGKPQGIAS